jgi:predicted nicotinamide N-methyase
MSAPPQFPPETPDERLGPLVTDRVRIDGRTFLVRRPDRYDHLLDDPAVRGAFLADDYLPYWAEVWPAARMLAKAVLREPWPAGLTALELGCGLGLAGLAALARGLRVIFSDYDRAALRFAAGNARLNGFREFQTLPLDWRHPPAGLRVPVILAADVIYERRAVEPLVALIKQALAPGGVCLLTDQDRPPAAALREELSRAGLTFTARLMRAGVPGGVRYKGTLYRIRHADGWNRSSGGADF